MVVLWFARLLTLLMTPSRLSAHCILFLSCSLSVLAQDFLSAKIISPSQLPIDTTILAVGDLNGDGVTDLVYSSSVPSSFYVAFGGPSGFQAGGTYPQALTTVTIADMNGDGKPDLVTGRTGPNAILLTYLNNGDGTFTGPTSTSVATGTNVYSIGVGDFDGDGKPDVIATTQNGGIFYFLHGNGDGTFAAPKSFSVPILNRYQIASTVDLSGDGKLDLVVSVIGASMVEVMLGNGNGTFRTAQPIPGAYNYSPFVADFNGDGIPDIATAADTAVNGDYVSTSGNIYAGNGDGTFTLINSVPYSSMPGSLLGVRDVNGDGKLDLVFDDPNGFIVCLGSGGAQFGPSVAYSVPEWSSAGSAIGDFNGDGLLDIITSFTYYPGTSQDVYLLSGFPGGTFEAAMAVDIGSMPETMATADLNHDGYPDLVASTNIGTWIYLSSSNGSYSSTSDTTVLGDQIFLADLDGDGNPDALYVPSFPYSTTSFRHGNGDGTFGNPVAGLSLGASGASLGDLNGDGEPDLVGIMDNSLYVWLGEGSGNFGAGVFYSSAGGYGGRTVIADVNNDGINDVVAIEPNNVTVLLGAGDGQGTLKPPVGAYPGSDFALADVNGDGKLDLLTISPNTSAVGVDVYLGDGTGSFGAPTFIPTSQAYSSIATGDLNLDGNPDLILMAGQAVGVLYGDGKGGFGAEHVFPVLDGPHVPIVADWNHDGAPDIAVANSIGGSPSPQTVSILLNRIGESATLASSPNPAQYGQPLSLTASIVPTVPGSATPGGSVSLSVGAIQLQGTLTNGSYSTPLTNLAVGSYPVSGSYSGDGNYRPTAFPALTLSIVKAGTTTSISPPAPPLIFGTALNFTVTVSPEFSGVPTGTVSLFDGVNLLGTLPLSTAGSANFVASSLSEGNHTLSAQYSGDGNFTGSTSAALTEQVLYPTTVSLTSSASSALIGSNITLTVNVASTFGTPTGTVIFMEGSTILDTVVLAGGTATFSSSTLSQGVHSIQAAYQGDGTFVVGSSTFNEAITDFSLSASSQSLTLTAGASGTYKLQLSPLSGFSGSVGLACTGAPEFATCAASPTSVQVSSGSSSATITVTTAGASAGLRGDHDVHAGATLNAIAVTFFLSFVGLFAAFTTARRKPVTVFALLLICGISACGGGSSTQATAPQTPSGTSTLTISATTAANGVTVDHTLTLTLVVK